VKDLSFFRVKLKSAAKYLKDIRTTVNKPISNLKYNKSNNFVVYHENTRGLSIKTEELSFSINNTQLPHILYLNEHHMKALEIVQVNLNSYTQGPASHFRQNVVKGGVNIFVKNSVKFNQIQCITVVNRT
jgi:hypothetical protein